MLLLDIIITTFMCFWFRRSKKNFFACFHLVRVLWKLRSILKLFLSNSFLLNRFSFIWIFLFFSLVKYIFSSSVSFYHQFTHMKNHVQQSHKRYQTAFPFISVWKIEQWSLISVSLKRLISHRYLSTLIQCISPTFLFAFFPSHWGNYTNWPVTTGHTFICFL